MVSICVGVVFGAVFEFFRVLRRVDIDDCGSSKLLTPQIDSYLDPTGTAIGLNFVFWLQASPFYGRFDEISLHSRAHIRVVDQ